MTAVSFASPSFSPSQAPLTSETRTGTGASAAAIGSAPKVSNAKPLVSDSTGASTCKLVTSKLSKAELASQINTLQVKMDKLNPALVFVLDQTSGKALIQLTDRNTHEVIQQFPTAAALQISKALDRFEKGQLISKIA